MVGFFALKGGKGGSFSIIMLILAQFQKKSETRMTVAF